MTDSFISLVCNDLKRKYGEEMRDHTLVFPGRRAIMFFQKNWLGESERPLWMPECVTIQELFASLDRHRYIIADELKLCVELYGLMTEKFTDLTQIAVPSDFDSFYAWGSTLISDFDDIDKTMADARLIFSNMGNIADIHTDYLTNEQKEILEKTFDFTFDNGEEMLEKYIRLCDELLGIYTDFKERLREKGIAYDGMRSRDAVEDEEAHTPKGRHYSFIGFNVLNEVEERLFKKIGKAYTHFYWDYDLLYSMSEEERKLLQIKTKDIVVAFEAGDYIAKNLAKYGCEITTTERGTDREKRKELFDNFRNIPKKIRYISAGTDTAQAKYLSSYLNRLHNEGEDERDTAVVLCDESLLLPVLHSIPDKYEDGETPTTNITMGYPISLTPTGSLLKAMASYQSFLRTYGRNTVSLRLLLPFLRHPYIAKTRPNCLKRAMELQRLNQYFIKTQELLNYESENEQTKEKERPFADLLKPIDDTDYNGYIDWIIGEIRHTAKKKEIIGEPLLKESLFRAYTMLTRLKETLSELEGVTITSDLVERLILRLVSTTTVPFHGEADKGLQVMGFLETRGLDFKNVCLLSSSEGILPPKPTINSFIPQSIRRANGLSTIENKSSLYAYYFYRLIQRASDITILYNSTPSNTGATGQMSRYMMQLLVDTELEVETMNIDAEIPSLATDEIVVHKNEKVVEMLKEKFYYNPEKDAEIIEKKKKGETSYLSPSAINSYITCPLKFYFERLLKLRISREKDGMEATDIGTIFHGCMEEIYRKMEDAEITKEYIDTYLKNQQKLSDIVVMLINKEFFKKEKDSATYVQESEFSGRLLVQKEMIMVFIKKQLSEDSRLCPFTYRESEGEHIIKLNIGTLSDAGEERVIKIGGLIDRVDEITDEEGKHLRVVDYKTGGSPIKDTSYDNMFNTEKKYSDRAHYPLQASIYAAMLYEEKNKSVPVLPTLSYVNKLKADKTEAQPPIPEMNNESYPDFMDRLRQCVSNIFDPNIPFTQTTIPDNCDYCDFKGICRKR